MIETAAAIGFVLLLLWALASVRAGRCPVCIRPFAIWGNGYCYRCWQQRRRRRGR